MDMSPEVSMLLSGTSPQKDEKDTNKKSLKRRRSVDHSWSAEMEQKMQGNIAEGRAGRRRTATACDRCKLKKIACDYTANGCMKCFANGIPCFVTDPVTGYSAERCSIPRMKNKIKELEEQNRVLMNEIDRLEAKLVFSNSTIEYLRLYHRQVEERGDAWAMGGSVNPSVFYSTPPK